MSLLQYRLEGTTAIVQMDDGKANALSEAMMQEIGSALDRAEKEASAVVLAGRADRFCGGFDLKVMMSGIEPAKALLRIGAGFLMRLYGYRLPLVAACTGHALAGGALVLLASDVRIGAAGAYRIGLNEVSIGLPVPALALALVRDRIAREDMTRATLCGTIYAPDDAARVGFLDRVVAAENVVASATEEAAKLGALSSLAIRGTKKRLRRRTIEHVLSSLEQDMNDMGSE